MEDRYICEQWFACKAVNPDSVCKHEAPHIHNPACDFSMGSFSECSRCIKMTLKQLAVWRLTKK